MLLLLNRSFSLLTLLLCLLFSSTARAQTIYTVVLGNQNHVVGSSTLKSGLFVSYDNATTWKHLGPKNLKAYSMDAVDSSNGRILYIAAGNGVHRSTDYGKSWKIVTDWRITEVLDVKIDQSNPNYLYAATAFGFWRSTDGGDSWTNPDGPLKERYCYRIESIEADSLTMIVDGPGLSDTWKTIQVRPDVPPSSSYVSSPIPIYRTVDLVMISKECGDTFGGRGSTVDIVAPFAIIETTVDISVYDDGIYALFPFALRRIACPLDTTPVWKQLWDEVILPSDKPVHALTRYYETTERKLPPSYRKGGVLLAGTFGDGIYKWDGKEWSFAGLPGSQVWRIITTEYTVPEEVRDER